MDAAGDHADNQQITPTAPAIEYAKSLGGVFLISVTALRATSRGCTFGFSGCALLLHSAALVRFQARLPEAAEVVCRFLSAAAVR